MSDKNKSKAQLLHELAIMRQRVAELEGSEVALTETKNLLSARSAELVEALEALNQETKRREQVEKALQESEGLYRSFFENSPISLWEEDFTAVKTYLDELQASGIHDLEAYLKQNPDVVAHLVSLVNVVNVNQKTLDFLGVKDKSEVLGPLKIPLDEALDTFREEILTFASGQTKHETETVGVSHEGQSQTILLGITIVPGYEESWEKVLASSLDITERKHTEEVVARERNLLQTMIDTIPDIIYTTDTEGHYLIANLSFLQRRGMTHPEELIGKTVFDFMERELAEEFYTEEQAVMRTGQGFVNREIYLAARPHNPWRTMTKIPIYNEHGEVSGLVVVSRDITETKRAQERELALTLEKERVFLLRKFIEKASHEFRTPLTIINSNVFSMSRAEEPEIRRAKSIIVEEQVMLLTRLVDMLLTLTRLESGLLPIPYPVDMSIIIETASQEINKKYKRDLISPNVKDMKLKSVMGNTDDLIDALVQILDNACRYTSPDDTITINVGEEEDKVWLQITDTGPGIAEEHLPHIFETFWRLDKAHKTPGFGLGLPIAKRIIEMYAGTMTVESSPGKGTNFLITFSTISD